ncbi:MAG: hypothetical protein D8M57_19410 [Candidatus Scalindua sp. AMX11]|nr:MAG: hypothetical protein DWQ00_03060 [Candidatus Scalindua sp.]NOG82209.1 hypothetical protein [Planctomycetota bacterium]RZV65492.1 MAG: hypothetical protein EX341_17960 [Candidatus Scalindua sp. SCAELEC01]TDE63216.1 MAG: hypothetical protein D8M57_19410 [Candidatus Scalindua sp. AMX11]NOG84189.1 hypothetical protein [Planctomycetota bacterium]
MEYKLKNEDYLNLWKYFQDKAISVKGAMFNTITWIIGFAAALIGFIFAKISDYDPLKAKISLPLFMIPLSIAGIVICIYAFFAQGESAKNIRKNLDSSDRCMVEIKGLDKIVAKETENQPKFVQIWNQLRIVVSIFLTSFIAILVWGLKIMSKV